jgi:hypothetical protein
MEQLRVPTVPYEATIRYFDERPMRGRIFVPALAQRHEGPMRVDEWINQTALFFPFLGAGAERAVILNKRYVVVLTLEEERTPPEHGMRISVACGNWQVEGVVDIAMPDHSRRLLDWVNRPELFLVVYEGGRRHIVQKHRITFLSEVNG